MAQRSRQASTHEQNVARIIELDELERDIDQKAEISKTPLFFEMGDRVLAEVPVRAEGRNWDGGSTLESLSTETGVPVSTLEQRRFVASRVLTPMRLGVIPWSVYLAIVYGPAAGREAGLVRLIELVKGGLLTREPTQYDPDTHTWEEPSHHRWTVDAILSHIGYPPANARSGSIAQLERFMRTATPEVKREALRTLASEPAVVDDVLEQPDIRRAVYEGLHRHEQQVSARTEREVQADPVTRNIDQQQAMIDLQRWVDEMRHHVERLRDAILPRLGQVPVSDPLAMRRFLAEALADLDEAIQPVRTFVETGGTDIDRFLSDVLGGNKRG
jgi:hypothetical protein